MTVVRIVGIVLTEVRLRDAVAAGSFKAVGERG
jgi:hypothetical protein